MKKHNTEVAARLQLADQELYLLPDHAVYWPEEATLFVADLHLGKEAAFRRASLPIPDTTATDLNRLSRLVDETKSTRLIALGDLLHHRTGMSGELVKQVADWREEHADVEVYLLPGNHDRHVEKLPEEWRIEIWDSAKPCGSFRLEHIPTFSSTQVTLAGHIHPKHRLRAAGEDLYLPCFILRGTTLILPAFSSFVDGVAATEEDDRIFVVAERHVLEVPYQPPGRRF